MKPIRKAAAKSPNSPYQKVLDHALDAVIGVDEQQHIIDWNLQAHRMFGWRRDEVLGRLVNEVVIPLEFREAHKKNLKRFIDTGKSEILNKRIELTALHRDGSKFPIELTIIPIENEGEQTFYSFLRDISERKRNEEQLERMVNDRTSELRASHKLLDSLIDHLPLMVSLKDAESLRFMSLNKAGEKMLGLTRDTLVGKNDFDFFPNEQAKSFVSMDRAVLAARKTMDIPDELINTRHGTRILHTRKIPLYGTDGRPEYLLGISEDITDKKQTEIELLAHIREEAVLREREEVAKKVKFLSDISSTLSTSLNYHDSLQNISKLIVPALCDWCTISVEKESGEFERVVAAHHDDKQNPILDQLKTMAKSSGVSQTIQTGKSRLFTTINDAELLQESGSEAHFQLIKSIGVSSYLAVPLRGRNRNLGALTLFMSDSQRKFDLGSKYFAKELGRRIAMAIDNALLYEKAQKAIQLRDDFLSMASHELKTPITSLKLQIVLNKLRIEKAEQLDLDAVQKLINTSDRQANRLSKLVDDMLDISRIDHGKLSIQREKVVLDELVEETLSRNQQLSQTAETYKLHTKKGVVGLWDRHRLEQVVINLFSNAVKYGEGKPIDVSVDMIGRNALFRISDQGMGIAEENFERIFERFERAVTTSNISGLGLGLYICKQIVEAHGGAIYVESELRRGSTFTVCLPL